MKIIKKKTHTHTPTSVINDRNVCIADIIRTLAGRAKFASRESSPKNTYGSNGSRCIVFVRKNYRRLAKKMGR